MSEKGPIVKMESGSCEMSNRTWRKGIGSIYWSIDRHWYALVGSLYLHEPFTGANPREGT